MYKKANIGMFGLGTVGTGVVKYLQQMYDPEKTGLELEISKICVRDLNKSRDVQLPYGVLTTNPNDILENPSIDVVVEVMGGIAPAGAYILTALMNKKHVVTANKAFITHPIEEDKLHDTTVSQKLKRGEWPKSLGGYISFIAALTEKRNLGFEASVCGEIPVISTVSELPSKNDVFCLEGILNGTSNYILTKMSEGQTYGAALKEAQEKGFAEADPSFDVKSRDAAQKLAILSTLIFGERVEVSQINCESIEPVKPQDIKYARDFGYVIKPVAVAKMHDVDLLELRVSPTLVSKNDVLASVSNEMNAVSLYLVDRNDSPLTLLGKGAGMMPTARSVVKDIVSVVKNSPESRSSIYNLFTCFSEDVSDKMQQFESASYLRLTVEDKPGVLALITNLLAKHNINIEEIKQVQADKLDGVVPVVMLLSSVREGKVNSAVSEMGLFEPVKEILKMRRKVIS